MYNSHRYVTRAPLRTAAYNTVAAGVLFGAPPLYAYLTSRVLHTWGPEPVTLAALIFAVVMCTASLSMTRGIRAQLAGSFAPGARQRHAVQAARRAAAAAGYQPPAAASPIPPSVGPKQRTGSGIGLFRRLCAAFGRAACGSSGPSDGPRLRSAHSSSSSLLRDSANAAGPGTATADPVSAQPPQLCRSRQHSSGGALASMSSSTVTSDALAPGSRPGTPGRLADGGGNRGTLVSGSLSSSYDPVGIGRGASAGGVARSVSGGASSASGVSTGSGSSGTLGSSPSGGGSSKQQTSVAAGGGGSRRGTGGGSTANPPGASRQATAPQPQGGGSSAKSGAVNQATPPLQPIQSKSVDPVAAPLAQPGGSKKKGAPNPTAAPSGAAHSSAASRQGPSSAGGAAAAAPTGQGAKARSDGGTKAAGSGAPANAASATSGSGASNAGSGKAATPPAAASRPLSSLSAASTASSTASGGSANTGSTSATNNLTASGLLARLAAGVTTASVSAASPGGKAAKKAGAAAKRQAPHPSPSPAVPPLHQPHQAVTSVHGYAVVPPPPPPPPRKVTAMAENPATPPPAAVAAAATPAAAPAAALQPVRNAWLQPNPAIRAAKGGKGAPATPRSTLNPASAPFSPTQRQVSSARSSTGGINPQDPPVLSTRSSGAASAPTPPTFNDPVSPPPPLPASSGTSLLGTVFAHGAQVVVGGPVCSPPRAKDLSTRSRGLTGGGEEPQVLSAAILASADTALGGLSFGTLVAHKHASGDLDIASTAANYRPYPSSLATANDHQLLSVEPGAPPPEDSEFSFFSIPPPAISCGAANGSAPGGRTDPGFGTLPLLPAMDMAMAPSAGEHNLHTAAMLYATFGGGARSSSGGGAALAPVPFAHDPVWGPAAPTTFPNGPSLLSRVPPPGFPAHAYGGAFATGPPAGTNPWAHHPAVVAAAQAPPPAPQPPAPADVLPTPGDGGALAALGFVDSAPEGGGGGGEEAGGSCSICWSAPRQVGFLHGKTSHLCVCRACAAQLREGVHRCPMCRQLIERIIDIF